MKYGRTGRFPAYPWYGNEVPDELRIPHTADRLGSYSKVAPNPNNPLLALTETATDLNNPVFKSYFVQEPTREPDPDVNFEKGDVLYENNDAGDGTTITRQVGYSWLAFTAFNMAHGAASGRFTYPGGTEFLDHRAEDLNMGNNFFLYQMGGFA